METDHYAHSIFPNPKQVKMFKQEFKFLFGDMKDLFKLLNSMLVDLLAILIFIVISILNLITFGLVNVISSILIDRKQHKKHHFKIVWFYNIKKLLKKNTYGCFDE